MARKDLLKGLMGGVERTRSGAPAPRMSKGAIGAVSKSIADLKTRALVDVPADLIDSAGLVDRLDTDEAGIEALAASIRVYGQQVPVLLRLSPNYEGRYQVVYGRRRVAALKRLGLPVKAMIRDLQDRDLIVAQGQENAARRDLTFIEQANFARQMVTMRFERKIICDALHIDKTVISRMLKVTDEVPEDLIRAIGSAPGVGRDRWLSFAAHLRGKDPTKAIALAKGETSDQRFEAVLQGFAKPKGDPAGTPPAPLTASNGKEIGQVSRSTGRTVLTFKRAEADGFDDWLAENINRIHRDFLTERGE